MNGHSIVDSKQGLAETFNYHFGSVGPKLASLMPNGDSSHLGYLSLTLDDENCLVLYQTDVATVYSLLSETHKGFYEFLLLSKLSQATGLDQISVRLLRECADLIAPSLCSIFNRCIVSGVVSG